MRRLHFLAKAVLVVGICRCGGSDRAPALRGDWAPLGPSGGSITALAVDPQNTALVYAAAGARVFRSQDAGSSWAAVASIPFTGQIDGLVVDPSDSMAVYANAFTRLFRSGDSGRTWTSIDAGLPAGFGFSLDLDPLETSTLYASAGAGGLFRSTDRGATWSRIDTAPPIVFLRAVVPARPAVLVASSNDAVFRSLDGGATWVACDIAPGARLQGVAIDPRTPTTLIGYGSRELVGAQLFRSEDAGAHWRQIQHDLAPLDVGALAVSPQDSSTLFAAILDLATDARRPQGVYRSRDGGRHWTPTRLSPVWVNALVAPPGALYAGTLGDGLYKSLDDGGSWAEADRGINAADLRSVTVAGTSPTTVFARSGGGKLWRRLDGEADWTLVFDGLDVQVTSVLADPDRPATVWAGTADGVRKSLDGGTTWVDLGPRGDAVVLQTLDPAGGGTLYAVRSYDAGGPYGPISVLTRSRDGGQSWTDLPWGAGLEKLVVDPQRPEVLFILVNRGRPSFSQDVFRSLDGGGNWKSIVENIDPQRELDEPGFLGQIDSRLPGLYSSTHNGLFRSVDEGDRWTRISAFQVRQAVVDPGNPSRLYGLADQVVVSSDSGRTWQPLGEGLDDVDANDLATDPVGRGRLFLATDHGVYAGTFQ